MALDLTRLVPIYKEKIDELIDQMGKPVTLYFSKTIENINNSAFEDNVIDGEIRKPSFKQTASSSPPTITYNTLEIKALINHNPTEFARFGIKVNQPQEIIRIKTYIYHTQDLKRCDFIIPNSNSEALFGGHYRLIRTPAPVGLQKDFFVKAYFELV